MRGATLFTKVSITCTSRQPWQESALSKVASCWWKSLPTWAVSAGYSAWHFFMDGVFLKKYPWTGCLLWQPGHLLQNFLTTLRMLMLKLTDCSSRVLATIELFFTILHRTQKWGVHRIGFPLDLAETLHHSTPINILVPFPGHLLGLSAGTVITKATKEPNNRVLLVDFFVVVVYNLCLSTYRRNPPFSHEWGKLASDVSYLQDRKMESIISSII